MADDNVYSEERVAEAKKEANERYRIMTERVLEMEKLAQNMADLGREFHLQSKLYVESLKRVQEEMVKPTF